jgi:hypothetical protein
LLAETLLANAILKNIAARKMTLAVEVAAVVHAIATFGVSQRRVCQVIGADRSSMRYRHVRPDDAAARAWLRELALRLSASADPAPAIAAEPEKLLSFALLYIIS